MEADPELCKASKRHKEKKEKGSWFHAVTLKYGNEVNYLILYSNASSSINSPVHPLLYPLCMKQDLSRIFNPWLRCYCEKMLHYETHHHH